MRKRQRAKEDAARQLSVALYERLAAMDAQQDARHERDLLLDFMRRVRAHDDPTHPDVGHHAERVLAWRDQAGESSERITEAHAVTLAQLRPLNGFFATHLKLMELEPRLVTTDTSLRSRIALALWLCPAELRALCAFYGLSTLPFPTFDHCANQLIRHASHIQHDDKVRPRH
jgi:hypothetical protein